MRKTARPGSAGTGGGSVKSGSVQSPDTTRYRRPPQGRPHSKVLTARRREAAKQAARRVKQELRAVAVAMDEARPLATRIRLERIARVVSPDDYHAPLPLRAMDEARRKILAAECRLRYWRKRLAFLRGQA